MEMLQPSFNCSRNVREILGILKFELLIRMLKRHFPQISYQSHHTIVLLCITVSQSKTILCQIFKVKQSNWLIKRIEVYLVFEYAVRQNVQVQIVEVNGQEQFE